MTDRYDELRAALAEMTATATTVAAMYKIGVIMRGAEALLSERDGLLAQVELFRAAYSVTIGEGGRRSWNVDPVKLATAHDALTTKEG